MANLPRQIIAEKENVEEVLKNLKIVLSRKDKSIVELAALATFLHNIYNGIENILKQTLKTKGIDISKSETWHKELLNISVKSKIITQALADKLFEYLTFRHFFIHSYSLMLEEEKLADLTSNMSSVWLEFMQEIEQFFPLP
ncbi:MAG: hypothetical protein NC818_00175 [Candidatus Omnitrophica bacterium]|nr:hypothetical protein [Candidatus Omnitrophota bacterium]